MTTRTYCISPTSPHMFYKFQELPLANIWGCALTILACTRLDSSSYQLSNIPHKVIITSFSVSMSSLRSLVVSRATAVAVLADATCPYLQMLPAQTCSRYGHLLSHHTGNNCCSTGCYLHILAVHMVIFLAITLAIAAAVLAATCPELQGIW